MADQWGGMPTGPGERWNVNLPAVVGVVFVFLVAVVAWVVIDARRSGGTSSGTVPPAGVVTPPASSSPGAITIPPTTPLATPPSTVALTTSPVPLPSTDAPQTSTTATTTTAAPTTTTAAPTSTTSTTMPVSTTTSVPAVDQIDLGVDGHALQRPACDGGYITVIGSAVGDEATAEGMEAVLDDYDGAHYLRTDVTCPSLTPSRNGEPIYVIYFGPFASDTDACDARSRGPDGAYVRRLSDDLSPDHRITCS